MAPPSASDMAAADAAASDTAASDAAASDTAAPDTAAAVRALARMARLLDKAAGDLELSHFRVLAMVADGDGRATRLARRLAVGKPAISATVDTLADKGLLERTTSVTDRRVVHLRLTARGRRVLADAEQAMAAVLSSVIDRTPDPAGTVAVLGRLNGALDEHLAARRAAG